MCRKMSAWSAQPRTSASDTSERGCALLWLHSRRICAYTRLAARRQVSNALQRNRLDMYRSSAKAAINMTDTIVTDFHVGGEASGARDGYIVVGKRERRVSNLTFAERAANQTVFVGDSPFQRQLLGQP